MLELTNSMFPGPDRNDFENWGAIERCLELAIRAEDLRERSRKLREASSLIREESTRISREVSSRNTSFHPTD